MKLHSLITSCALGAASIASAQISVSTQQPEASVKKAITLIATAEAVASKSLRGLGVQAGSLEDAIKELEASDTLPTIVFGPGARELKLAAPLRIKEEVRPVDALALIAAAAGGILEPIYSPLPPGKGEQPAPIGYKILPATRQTTLLSKTPAVGATRTKVASQSGAIGVSFSSKDGAIVIEKILPGSPADQKGKPGDQIVAVGEDLKGDVYTNDLPIEKVAELIAACQACSCQRRRSGALELDCLCGTPCGGRFTPSQRPLFQGAQMLFRMVAAMRERPGRWLPANRVGSGAWQAA